LTSSYCTFSLNLRTVLEAYFTTIQTTVYSQMQITTQFHKVTMTRKPAM